MTTCRWLVWVGGLLLASTAWAQGATDSARKLVNDGKFKEAVAELDALAKQPGNPRETMLELFELQGLAYGGLKQAPKSKTAFQKLLELEPAWKLKGKVPPKAAASFKDAKKWLAGRVTGPLKAEQLTPEVKDKKVVNLYVSVENDAMTLVKQARVHQRIDGGAWMVKEVPAQATTTVEAGGKVVQWWLELLGDNGAVLFVLGSEAEPIVDAVPGAVIPKSGAAAVAKKDEPKKAEPPKKDEPKKDAPVAEAKPSLVPEEKPEPAPDLKAKGPKGKGPNVLPWVLAGAGVASVGVGVAFGVMSSGARSQIDNASVEFSTGYVTGITRAEALQLEQTARTDAIVANTLIGAGAGLIVGGALAWFLGGN